jgi:hypothetical protein
MTTDFLAADFVEVARAPAGQITDDPALVRLPSGRLLASYTFRIVSDPKQENSDRFRIAHSDDDGATWNEVARLEINMGQPLLHDGALYLIGNRLGRRDIIALRSDDDGRTWSDPVTLFAGSYWNAPTADATRDGVYYRAFDTGDNSGPGGRWAFGGTVLIAADLSGDLLDPVTWRISPACAYPGTPQQMVAGCYPGHWVDHWLEPNTVNVRGRIRVLTRARWDGYGTSAICGVLDASDDGTTLGLDFTQYYPMPGAQNKFYTLWDEASRLFWSPVNLPTDTQDIQQRAERLKAQGFSGRPGNERRFMLLQYSVDALNWFPAGFVAAWPKPSQSFHYVCPLVDGDNLLLLSRTSRDAGTQHDSELVTFHRVRDFRTLAMDLYGTFDSE